MATEEVDFLPQWKRTRTSKYAFSFRDIHLSQLWYHIYMISLFIVCLSFQENVDFKLFWEHLHLQRYQALSSLSGRDIETITAVSLDLSWFEENSAAKSRDHRDVTSFSKTELRFQTVFPRRKNKNPTFSNSFSLKCVFVKLRFNFLTD